MRVRRPLLVAVIMILVADLVVVVAPSPVFAAALAFAPSADAYVQRSTPNVNYGRATRVVVDNSPARRVFLKFKLSGLGGVVTSARLRLHTISGNAGSNDGGAVRSMTDVNWAEGAVTWNSQPATNGTTLGNVGAVTASHWYEVDVSRVVTGNGVYSFVMTSSSVDGAYYSSRESGVDGPRLLITTAPAPGRDPVLVGASDIALCGSSGDDATAKLLDGTAGTVFTAGDNSQDRGTPGQYTGCYQTSWGRHKWRTRPAPGNHDYYTAGAAGYYGYFGTRAGTPGSGYYSYDLGGWHVVALNSNCAQAGGCGPGSPQERWLRADLAASRKRCTVAYWHHPLFTSGAMHGPATEVRPLYQALYDYGAEIVISGHNHDYERFAPQNPAGRLDNARGIRQFVVGTGGMSHRGFGAIAANSQLRNADTFGVLKLTLKTGGYEWRFVPVAGKSFTDRGSGTCHDADAGFAAMPALGARCWGPACGPLRMR